MHTSWSHNTGCSFSSAPSYRALLALLTRLHSYTVVITTSYCDGPSVIFHNVYDSILFLIESSPNYSSACISVHSPSANTPLNNQRRDPEPLYYIYSNIPLTRTYMLLDYNDLYFSRHIYIYQNLSSSIHIYIFSALVYGPMRLYLLLS